jgi:hypothetical protein
MQYDTPRIKGWKRPNLMSNVVKKTSKTLIIIKRMTRQANNQALAHDPTHNFKHV